MGFHGQVAVKCNTKVIDSVRQVTDALPTVSEKEEQIDRDILPEDTLTASVFSSFSLSLFNAIDFRMERRSGI